MKRRGKQIQFLKKSLHQRKDSTIKSDGLTKLAYGFRDSEYFKLKIYQLPEISNVKELWLMTKTDEEAKNDFLGICFCKSEMKKKGKWCAHRDSNPGPND